MFQGLRTVIYRVPDLTRAKAWYSEAFGIQPYFDEPFYVGFNIGGYELGLDPNASAVTVGNNPSRTGACRTSRQRTSGSSIMAPRRARRLRMSAAASRSPPSLIRSGI
jgi:catechol 2,3-dioxygenase-like lactoylglutathione lyase family enzyme